MMGQREQKTWLFGESEGKNPAWPGSAVPQRMSQGTSPFPWRQGWLSKQPGLDLQSTSGSLGELQIDASSTGTSHGLALHPDPGQGDGWGHLGVLQQAQLSPQVLLEGDRVPQQTPCEGPVCVISAAGATGIGVVSTVLHHRVEVMT